MKIYTDDPLVSYKESTIDPLRTKDQIDALLRAFKVTDIHWHWNPDANDVYVQFGIEEVIEGVPVRVAAKVVCPAIWDKAIRNSPKPERRVERINLRVSMRALYWYIKTHLETSYAMQSSRVAGFLPNIVGSRGKTIEQTLIPRISELAALPEHLQGREPEIHNVEVTPPQQRRNINQTEIFVEENQN